MVWPGGAADAKGKLARVATGQGRYEEALTLCEEAIEELRDIGSHGDVLEVQARKAECLFFMGNPKGALLAVDEALRQAQALGGVPPPQIPILQRVRGAALALSGDRDAALVALRQSLQASQVRAAEFEAALTMRVLATLDVNPDEQDALSRQAARTLAKLGWSGRRTSSNRPPRSGPHRSTPPA